MNEGLGDKYLIRYFAHTDGGGNCVSLLERNNIKMISWKVRNFYDNYLTIRSIKDGIKNLIKWFPLIWKDRNFDQGYLYDILYFKLGEMQKFFESDNTYSMDAKEYGKQIKECKELLKRIINETIEDENWDGENFTISIEELGELVKQERKLFWNKMFEYIDGWWD